MEHQNRPIFQPNRAFSKEARVRNICEYKELTLQAHEDYEGFWAKLADEKISWMKMP